MRVIYNIRAVASSSASKVLLKTQKDKNIKPEDSTIANSSVDSELNEHLL